MTAEEKLKEEYDRLAANRTTSTPPIKVNDLGHVKLNPYDIDLIANLVVERLKNGR